MKTIPVKGGVPLHVWTAEPLDRGVRQMLERVARLDDVAHVAVMPDVHFSGDVCVGTVLATRNLIYPAAVGGDIGCGMTAVGFDCDADLLASEPNARSTLDALPRIVPAVRHHQRQTAPGVPDELHRMNLSHPSLESLRRRDGAIQFGTLGRGNHFVELQADEDNRLWLLVHSGSRAMGPAIRDLHTAVGATSKRIVALDACDTKGAAYLRDADWARSYASASRDAMVAAIADWMALQFGVHIDSASRRECDHNHVINEQHFDEMLWVHRKGAARAGEAEAGIIPGSMGTMSFHTIGRGNAKSLCSSSHGAGRIMPRGVAERQIRAADLIDQMRGVWFDRSIAAQLTEEAPEAYKDIKEVFRAQRDLTRIARRLRPVLVYKAT